MNIKATLLLLCSVAIFNKSFPQSGEISGDSQQNKHILLRNFPKGYLKLGGRLHRAVMLVDDGASRQGFFMDSDQSPTMLQLAATQNLQKFMTLSGTLELGIQSNRPFRVSQEEPNPGTDITVRIVELSFDIHSIGKLSFGRGTASAWVVSEADLSGTAPAVLLAVGNHAPGMRFVDQTSNELSPVSVSDYFVDTERLLFVDRIRFDSRRIAGGMIFSGSLAADRRWDAAFRYYPSFESWEFRAALTYQHKPFRDIDNRVDVYISARHRNTGISLTSAASKGHTAESRNPAGYVVKAGWLYPLIRAGSTAFSIDYTQLTDALHSGEKANSVGIFARQSFDVVGIDLYTGYRRYSVAHYNLQLNPMDTYTIGAIYTF